MRTFIFFVFSLVLLSKVFSQNSIAMYNNTDKKIYCCYAFFDNTNKCWTSRGWYAIDSYTEKTLNLGNYVGDIYIHGYSTNPATFWTSETYNKWGKGYSFCINHGNTFEIRFADKINCDTRETFSQQKIKYGKNTWTFNP